MKRLMILGGMRYALPVIEAAHRLSCHVITADYLPDNFAHKYSDEYCNVSITDKEATLKEAAKLKIDGIVSFACDPGVVTAAYVADRLGLPSCGPYRSVQILQNKGLFRSFLAENGFNVPFARSYHDKSDITKDLDNFVFPVIVKPTDSAGSKGVTRVDDVSGIQSAVEYALKFSKEKEFIIEEFIEQNGFSSDTDSFSVNGELKFVSYNCQRFDKDAENPYTPAAYSWPSSMTAAHQAELTQEINRLLKLLDMKTSIYNIETRESKNGKAYIMECSPRGGGNRLAECLRYATGVDMIENSVRAALDMPIVGIEQKPYNGCWAEIILHGKKAGIFEKLEISDSIKDCVIEEDLWVTPGTAIGGFSAANEAVGTLILKFRSEDMLLKVMDDVSSYISVTVKPFN